MKSPIGNQFVSTFIEQPPVHEANSYKRVWNGAVDALYTSQIIGIGPDDCRLLYPTISADKPDVACHKHPHNYYLQILGEPRLLDVVLATEMIVLLIWTCFKASLTRKTYILAATCFAALFGFLPDPVGS